MIRDVGEDIANNQEEYKRAQERKRQKILQNQQGSYRKRSTVIKTSDGTIITIAGMDTIGGIMTTGMVITTILTATKKIMVQIDRIQILTTPDITNL